MLQIHSLKVPYTTTSNKYMFLSQIRRRNCDASYIVLRLRTSDEDQFSNGSPHSTHMPCHIPEWTGSPYNIQQWFQNFPTLIIQKLRNTENTEHKILIELITLEYLAQYLVAYTAPDTTLFSTEKYWYFSYFSMKTYVVGTH